MDENGQPRLKSFAPSPQYITPGAQILKYVAVDICELLNHHDQEVMLEDAVEFGNKAPLKKPKNLSLSLRRGTWPFWSWLRCLRVTKAGINVSEDIASNEQRAATTRQGIVRKVSMRIFWRRSKGLFKVRRQCLISSSQLQGLLHGQMYCYTMEMMTHKILLNFKRKCLLLKLPPVCHLTYFVNVS